MPRADKVFFLSYYSALLHNFSMNKFKYYNRYNTVMDMIFKI